jgi:hypothetical protein
VGGWTVSGILNAHSGFPFSAYYDGLGGNAVIPNSGQGNLLPAAYLGGAGTSQGTDTFKFGNGNFTACGVANCFVAPTVVNNSGSWPVAPVGPLPTPPGIHRNSFYGPHYFDIDATVTKAFGLPRIPGLGENARVEIRANAYNLFNKLNLADPIKNINDGRFGRAEHVLAGRTVELEGRFRF